MKQRKCLVGGALLLFLAVPPGDASGAAVPLTILNKTMNLQDRALSFDLWNTSDKTIAAWRLSLAFDDGFGRSNRSVLDQDFALTAASREAVKPTDPGVGIERSIPPGEVASSAWTVELSDTGTQSSALSLRVVAVVFEDGSFAGDSEVARAILAARAARLEEMKKALAFLRDSRATGQGGIPMKESLAARARELRRESGEAMVSDGLRREAAAQLSAAKLEAAELFENLESSIGVEVMNGAGGLLGSAITGLEAQIAAGRAHSGRGVVSESSEFAARARREVQR